MHDGKIWLSYHEYMAYAYFVYFAFADAILPALFLYLLGHNERKRAIDYCLSLLAGIIDGC